MNKSKADIVIIDDGVNPELCGGVIQFDIEVDNELIIKNNTTYPEPASHGTTCATIIKKYAQEATIGSIKILNDRSGRGTKFQLMKAIQWCIENEIRIVNLSLGTIDFRDFDEVRYCINEAAEKGMIIVAACNNKNVYTVPACLTNVIGVKCRKFYTNDQFDFHVYPFNGIDISASGRHYLTDVNGNSRYTNPSNSFASPLIVAKVYKLIRENSCISLEEIKQKLFDMAINKKNEKYNPYFSMNIDWKYNYNDLIDDSQLISKQKSTKFWCEKLYIQRLNSINEKIKEPEAPTIALYSDETDISNKVHQLYEQFYNDGYHCILVSDDCKDILNGYVYLPYSISAKKVLSLIYYKYNCDVILLKIESSCKMEEIEKNINIDLKVYIKENEHYDLHYTSNKDEITSLKINSEIGIVYNNIRYCFEKE